MCGIAGFIDTRAGSREEELQATAWAMANTLRHRGPDDGGVWVDAACGMALGHRRLSIIDLSPLGHQPMVSACGRYVVVYNGEIYNFQSLRSELESGGYVFRSTSDTEVMLAAISAWGLAAALERFNGMFAFAVWDRQERCLHLARDRAGEKPLYYGWIGPVFLFASELKALRAHPCFDSEIDRDAVSSYVGTGFVPAPLSIYTKIRKLLPASCLTVKPSLAGATPAPVPYWSMIEVAKSGLEAPFRGSDREAIDALEALLREAVRLRMIADVPLGAFLSGGIDSSTIVALMQAQASRPVKTFTIGFSEAGYNEADHARSVARHLGTEHTELYVGPKQAMDVIPRLPLLYDEPFADSSQIPTFLVSELARRRVTVSLSGDAGDELFGGYNLYRAGRALQTAFGWMPLCARRLIGKALLATPLSALNFWLAPFRRLQGRFGRVGSIGDRLHKLAPVLFAERSEAMYLALMFQWKGQQRLVAGNPAPSSAMVNWEHYQELPDVTHRMMYVDTMTYLPDDILVKVDRAAMGVSLESRIPLLDHRAIEFAWRLPLRMKLRHGRTKWILRQLLYRYIPRVLADQPKSGFAVPISAWLRGPLREWAEDLLAADRLRQEGYFDWQAVRKTWTEHLSGRRNWKQPLWSTLMFEAWLRLQSGRCLQPTSGLPGKG